MPPEYGDYEPGLGYATGTDQYGTTTYSDRMPPRVVDGDQRRQSTSRIGSGRVDFRSDVPSTDELRRQGNAAAFRPSTSMERARQLRDSDREDDRRRYASLSRTTRAELAGYEDGLRAHLDLGRPLPDGVRAPAGYEPPKDAA